MHPQVSSSSAVSVPMSGEEDAVRSLARERQLSPHAAGAMQHFVSAPMTGVAARAWAPRARSSARTASEARARGVAAAAAEDREAEDIGKFR